MKDRTFAIIKPDAVNNGHAGNKYDDRHDIFLQESEFDKENLKQEHPLFLNYLIL